MNKNFIYAMLSAIALTGTVGFSSCTSSDEVAEVNPDFNAETNEVTTDFVFNVSTGNTATTRMSQANTQATIEQTFRGIDNTTLLSFKLGTNKDGKNVAASTTSADKLFSLGTIMGAGSIDPDGTGSIPKSRRVIELTLPTETNCLMFWGKAIKTEADYQQGKTDWTMSKTLADQAFSLVRVVPDDASADADQKLAHGQTALHQYQNLIAAMLTKIIQTSVEYDVTYPVGSTDPNDKYQGTLAWSDYVEVNAQGKLKTKTTEVLVGSTDPMCSLGEILGNAYVTFNTIGDNELRAGSGKAVARMIGDLYAVILRVSQAIPTSNYEAIAKEVGVGIQENIEAFFANPSTLCAFKDITSSTNKTSMLTSAGVATGDANLVTEDLNEFPMNFDLPAGATILTIFKDTENDNNLTYAYMGSVPTYAMGGSTTTTSDFDPKNYMYPPELCYFGNSPIRVTNDPHETADYPDGTSDWANDANAKWTGWDKDGHVLSSTRSVAMQNNINYGTSLLKTTIRYNTGILYDNNHAIQAARSGANEQDATIDVTSAGQFELTGILIGGQEQTMGWNYLAKAGANAKFDCMVYDRDLPATAIPAYDSENPTATSTPCFTTVWDNWDEHSKDGKQRDVYIALEFKNNSGKDFWGMNNLIRNEGVFYITAKLDPDAGLSTTDRSEGIIWPSTTNSTTAILPHALPPYDVDGNTIKQRRVFIQDYMTTANFVIGEKSLQYALVAVPDLRSAQISLGLSVDIQWSTGLIFNDVLIGGNGE